MGFENMVEHCNYNQTRNFIDSRKFTLSEEEIVSCNQWLNDYCNAPYTLLKESIDEFSWGLEQDDTPTGFEQHITALEMTLLPQNQTGKKQMLANRISAMLGNSPAEIQQLYQKVMNFYRFRSESLHEGNDSNITDTELHKPELRKFIKACLTDHTSNRCNTDIVLGCPFFGLFLRVLYTHGTEFVHLKRFIPKTCLLYTSDAADE